MDTAKIFWSGRSQAVRLPRDYRFDAAQVRIRRHGQAVILEPVAQDWLWLEQVVAPLDDDFAQAATEAVDEQPRAALDFFR